MESNTYWKNFSEKNKEKWHYDPSVKSQDYTYIGKLKTDFKPLLDLLDNDDNCTEHLIVNRNDSHAELDERVKAFQEWGYSEANTRSLQITDENFPEVFKPFKEFAGFGECNVVALKQYPGQFLPWHEDGYVGFRKRFNIPDNVEVTRYSLFLEDWTWGHYFAAGNNIIHQWKQGDIIELPNQMHHVTCNAGMEPKLTMTITGSVTDVFLERKKVGKFEI